jgi:SAM-dependent methyltransferase
MDFIDRSIEKAKIGESHLSKDILNINGMSSDKVRHLLNNLCSRENTNYLEVGSWRGSTFLSAISNNPVTHAVAIDNFSQFVEPHPHTKEWLYLNSNPLYQFPIHPRYELENNIKYFELDHEDTLIDVFDMDCQSKELLEFLGEMPKFNVYFYDGEHSYESQKLGIKNYLQFLTPDAIIVVDDWNASDASRGTVDGIEEAGKKIKYRKDLMSRGNCDREGFWNGVGIICLE